LKERGAISEGIVDWIDSLLAYGIFNIPMKTGLIGSLTENGVQLRTKCKIWLHAIL
jgi:hypothetical protein